MRAATASGMGAASAATTVGAATTAAVAPATVLGKCGGRRKDEKQRCD